MNGMQGREEGAQGGGKRVLRTLGSGLVGLALVAVSAPVLAQKSDGWLPDFSAPPPGPEIERVQPEPETPTAAAEGPVVFEVTGPLPFGRMRGFLEQDSLSLAVDGNDRTAEAEFEPGGLAGILPWVPARTGTIRFLPDPPLADGNHTLIVQMSDTAGNTGSLESPLVVDTQPPEIGAHDPGEGAVITELDRPLVLAVSDAGVGVDWDSLRAEVEGHSPNVEVDQENGHVTLTPQSEWAEGELSVVLTVADTLGNGDETSVAYTVQPDVPLAADIRARPTSGTAPLTVRFAPEVKTNTAIETYRWDFDGDGSTDRSEPIGRDQSYTYSQPGTYEARLTVADSRGEEVTTTVAIEVGNAPPEVTATARPSNGSPPLDVQFTANASDRDGIDGFEWDFDGDGVYDRTMDTGTASYTYAVEGTFQPRIRVTDTLGASRELAVPSIEIRLQEGAPTVTASASPTSGQAPLSVNFGASATDPDGSPITQWAWDFEGDGTVDYRSTTGPGTSFEYTAPGTYYPRVTATAEDGDTSRDIVRVVVEPSFALDLSTDTIDTEIGETVTAETTLGGDTRVRLVVERPGGEEIATVVPWQTRQAGTHTDTWNGTAADGEPVSEGEYRFVLLYEIDGVVRRYDLGPDTGGREYNPSRSRLPSSFAPFAGDPLRVSFSLPEASRVTAFIGRFNVNSRMVTFFQRTPLGRGSHAIRWNGTNSQGELIHPPPNDEFLFGIFAFTLPDNAVYVRSGVHVTNLQADPPILTPAGAADTDEAGPSRISFDLSRAGDVVLTVANAETGAFVDQRRYEGLDAGPNTIQWDGRGSGGELVAPGRYRLGVTGIDERGGRTPTLYTLQRIYY